MSWGVVLVLTAAAGVLCACRVSEGQKAGPPVEVEKDCIVLIPRDATPRLIAEEVLGMACEYINSSQPQLRGAKCVFVLFASEPNTAAGADEWLLLFRWQPWSVYMEYLVVVNDRTREIRIYR
jgi:hypothetical protein